SSEAGLPDRVGRGELAQRLETAGFTRVSVEVVPHVQFQPSADAAIEFAQASSFGNSSGTCPLSSPRARAPSCEPSSRRWPPQAAHACGASACSPPPRTRRRLRRRRAASLAKRGRHHQVYARLL